MKIRRRFGGYLTDNDGRELRTLGSNPAVRAPLMSEGVAHLDGFVVREVVENAILHARDAAGEHTAPQTVQIAARQSGAFLMLTVHNSGAAPVGGPTTQAAFAPFGKNAGGPDGGLGIGLPLAQRILELHGGMLRLRTDTDGLTEVTIQVPTGAPHQNLQRADMEQARKYAEDLARLMATRRTTANTTTK